MIKEFGKRMKSRREQLGWSLRRLGDESNASASFLSDIENNKTFPSMEKAQDIANALKVPISWLLGEMELEDVDNMLVNNVEKDGIMYDLFLSKHTFPNGLTYEQMCAKINLLEKLQSMLNSSNDDKKEK